MSRKIVIYRGDEHRFKVEKKFKKDDFFYDVYQKAQRVTDEIIETMQQSREEISQPRAQFYGIANNIIVFCGTRGEGKTSALQSFAHHLKHADDKMYTVLDTIDPSEMNSRESIVKVFLSRLCSCFQFLYEDVKKADTKYDEKDMILDRQDILERLNKCYNNLTYMLQEQKQDFYQDNLDYLFELGDSRNLRKNLFFLIERVLEFKHKYVTGNSGEKGCLVILIDDADLSMGNIFKICEDIRNYFSLPNAVVLMAADFEQLRSAIYQKYLKHYKTILVNDKKINYKSKCYSMATKFMEKMFPNDRRIELPNINHEIQRNANTIKLKYKKKLVENENQKDINVFDEDEWKNCSDIQEQLIKSLYVRTGVILEKRYDIQTFLPHTLRELTHFLKLLSGMKVINFEGAVLESRRNKSLDDMPILRQWKNNLEELKRYYLRYWIQNYLKSEQVQLIKQMDKINQNNKAAQIGKLVFAYIRKNKKKDNTEAVKEDTVDNFAYLLNLIRKSTALERELQDALYIYFSIVLNSDFVQELILHKDFSEFVDYLKIPFNFNMSEGDNLEYFSFNRDEFERYAVKDPSLMQAGMSANQYCELFCTEVNQAQETKEEEHKQGLCHFNALGAVLGFISQYENLRLNAGESFYIEGSEEEDPFGEIEEVYDNRINWSTFRVRAAALISAKNIVSNLEIRFQLEEVLEEFLPRWNKRYEGRFINSYVSLYRKIDNIINQRRYLRIESSIGRFLGRILSRYGVFWKSSYLSNKEYRDKYLEEIKQDIQSLIEVSHSKLNYLQEEFQKQETTIEQFKENATNAVTDIISSIKDYSLLREVTIQNTSFETLLEKRREVVQAWRAFSSRLETIENLEEQERDILFNELKSFIDSCEEKMQEEKNAGRKNAGRKSAGRKSAGRKNAGRKNTGGRK